MAKAPTSPLASSNNLLHDESDNTDVELEKEVANNPQISPDQLTVAELPILEIAHGIARARRRSNFSDTEPAQHILSLAQSPSSYEPKIVPQPPIQRPSSTLWTPEHVAQVKDPKYRRQRRERLVQLRRKCIFQIGTAKGTTKVIQLRTGTGTMSSPSSITSTASGSPTSNSTSPLEPQIRISSMEEMIMDFHSSSGDTFNNVKRSSTIKKRFKDCLTSLTKAAPPAN